MADNSSTFLCNPEIYLLLFRFFIYLFFTQIILLSVLVSDYGYRNKRKEEKKYIEIVLPLFPCSCQKSLLNAFQDKRLTSLVCYVLQNNLIKLENYDNHYSLFAFFNPFFYSYLLNFCQVVIFTLLLLLSIISFLLLL